MSHDMLNGVPLPSKHPRRLTEESPRPFCSRVRALRLGRVRFYDPDADRCPLGHDSEHFAATNQCCECMFEVGAKQRKNPSGEKSKPAQKVLTYGSKNPCEHGHTRRFVIDNSCATCARAQVYKKRARSDTSESM